VEEQWQVFVADCEYGYDFRRNAIRYGIGNELVDGQGGATIDVARGWQSSGMRLRAGTIYQIRASGRFQIAKEGQPWTSEPNGVTLRYHRGRPLGILLGNVRGDQPVPGLASLAAPVAIGSIGRIRPVADGTLYLRIHDHPAELLDNYGEVTVEVHQVSSE
jgi:hypothetical protein